jgi:hypothetical protein
VLAALALACLRLSAQTPTTATALVGATVIDGNGGPPIADAVVLLCREFPDDLVMTLRERRIICSMLASTITGPASQRHLTSTDEVLKKREETEKAAARGLRHEQTTASGARMTRIWAASVSRRGGRTRKTDSGRLHRDVVRGSPRRTSCQSTGAARRSGRSHLRDNCVF